MVARRSRLHWQTALHVAGIALSAARNWGLFAGSVLALYILQPATPIPQLDFWLPSASLLLTLIVWFATQPWQPEAARVEVIEASFVVISVLAIAALGSVDAVCCVITRTPPPSLAIVLSAILGGVVLCAFASIIFADHPDRTIWLVIALIGLMIVSKLGWPVYEGSAVQASPVVNTLPAVLQWLGFSYITFRLIHALRDRAAGKLPDMSLREFITYVVFFPSLIAGPIDRIERFLRDLRAEFVFNPSDLVEGSRRLLIGVFKKFVIADALAIVALDDMKAMQTSPGLWAWVMLYAYAFRIFFDFSGYTDMALGLARIFGVKLPENFNRPYLKPNLTLFWNSWHITLAQWFRSYYFNPLTRALRVRNVAPSLIIFVAQTTTMVLIGLWHGITWNFAIWGLWHALGLFIHSRWSEFAKARFAADSAAKPRLIFQVLSVVLTFHFVALGWVWFALSNPEVSLTFFRRLVGLW